MRLDALRELLGGKGLLTEAPDLAAYETGARYDHGRAAFVARPSTTAQVSAVMKWCAREGITLVPQSGNTGLVAGSTPDSSGAQAVLSLDRLTAPFALDRVNRSVHAGAGYQLSQLNAKLEPDGLFFPIDLGADPRLGGMLATNTGDSRFLRYGDVRRNVLGLTVVLADAEGTVLELGKGLRKDNAGIDWKQLFVGSFGAFGVITECVLNLELVPRQSAAALLVPESSDCVLALLIAMEDKLGALLSAFEGMSGNAMKAAFAHVPSLRNPFQHGQVPSQAILVEVSRTNSDRPGEQPLSTMLEEVLAEIWESEEGLLADALVGPAEELWALRHALSEGVKHSGHLIAFDVSFRRGDTMRFLSHIRSVLPQRFPGLTICDFGHVGDGGVHLNIVAPDDDPRLSDPSFEGMVRSFVVEVAVQDFQGSFSAEHGLGRRNQLYYDRFTPDAVRRLTACFKTGAAPIPIGTVAL